MLRELTGIRTPITRRWKETPMGSNVVTRHEDNGYDA
jgi:hypothetical protein